MSGQKLEVSEVEEILKTTLEATDGTALVVNPSESVLSALVATATAFDGDLPTMKVLGERGTLKAVRDEFNTASRMADLREADALSIRATDHAPRTSALVTEETATALVPVGDDHVAGFDADDPRVAGDAFEFYTDEFEGHDEFRLRTPARSRVMDTLEDEFGADAQANFEEGLSQIVRPNVESVDEVVLALLVAAKSEALLYDISKWGEDVGVASKATFSRTKSQLEDTGLIETEKVPIDVGRPRLRLKLNADLRDDDIERIVSTAESVLQ